MLIGRITPIRTTYSEISDLGSGQEPKRKMSMMSPLSKLRKYWNNAEDEEQTLKCYSRANGTTENQILSSCALVLKG